VLREARTARSAGTGRFLAAAAELGWQPRVAAGLCSQIAMRLLIQAGPPLTALTDAAIAAFDEAITARERACGRALKHYRDALYTSRTVIYHMGAPVRPVARKSTFHCAGPGPATLTAPRRVSGGRDRLPGVRLRHRARATVLAWPAARPLRPVPGRLRPGPGPRWPGWAGNGTIEPWLAAVAAARNPRTGTVLSGLRRRSRVLTGAG